MSEFSDYIVPGILLIIVLVGLIKKAPCFDLFLQGIQQGLISAYKIAPSLIGLIVAVNMLRASGMLDALADILKPVLEPLGFPAELVPFALLRPFSGGGSTAILNDILNNYGADSFIGTAASVMAGSTETTFYAVTVYYGSIGIKQIRHTLPCALLADIGGMVMSVLTARIIIFGG
ncbi:MAG: spore maturation protein [Acutalibacteraceae bacterium]